MDTKLLDSTFVQTREIAAWIAGADPAASVPTCPGWTLADLVDHIGATQRWVTKLVADGISEPAAAFSVGWEKAPAEVSAWSDWLLDGAHGVTATFAATTDARDVFDPSGGTDGVAFWSRRVFGRLRCTASTLRPPWIAPLTLTRCSLWLRSTTGSAIWRRVVGRQTCQVSPTRCAATAKLFLGRRRCRPRLASAAHRRPACPDP